MDLRHIITTDYQEAVRLLPGIPGELRKSLKAHSRVPTFVDNLTKQISRLPPHLKPDRLRIKQIVYDMTNIFVMNVKRIAEEKHMSDLAKRAEIEKAQKAADLAATASGKPQGEYEELSEVIDKDAGVNNGREDKAGEEEGRSSSSSAT